MTETAKKKQAVLTFGTSVKKKTDKKLIDLIYALLTSRTPENKPLGI